MAQNFPQLKTVTNLKNQKVQNVQAKLIKRYPNQIHHRETQNAKDFPGIKPGSPALQGILHYLLLFSTARREAL